MLRENNDLNLFEVSAKIPDGFIYRENFISGAEEQELIREIQQLQLTPFQLPIYRETTNREFWLAVRVRKK